ncbi:MAG: amidotransferase [Chitinivibrionales bacterium]|nr:amidotransferase [Chitinivibrionales bacterium]
MKIHWLQHVPFEGLGTISRWAGERGYTIEGTRLFEGAPPPSLDEFEMLVVMGGPMGVGDENTYSWINVEKRFIERAIGVGKCVVGVCLGAQLIAEVLGARVYRAHHREIGWFPVSLTAEAHGDPTLEGFPSSFESFHWHGDTFDVPEGGRCLAGSEACENQIFAYDDGIVGLQCHLEATAESIQALLENCHDELGPGMFVQSENEMRDGFGKIARMRPLLDVFLDNLVRRRFGRPSAGGRSVFTEN